jgi:hypothetical protein
MAAMVFALHAFEAYLNFVGIRLAPDLWEDEQNFFRKEPYRGFEGKVRKVFELCRLTEPDRLARPYSTIWALKALRDLIAHGKIEVFSQTYAHSVSVQPRFSGAASTSLSRTPRHLKRSRTPTPLPVFSTQRRGRGGSGLGWFREILGTPIGAPEKMISPNRKGHTSNVSMR